MKNKNHKKSNSRPTLLVYASCNAVLLLITLLIAYLLFLCGGSMILEVIFEGTGFNLGLLLPVFVFAFFIASLFAAKGYFERVRNQLAHYSRIGEEQKRVERLMIQAKMETVADTATLDDLAKAKSMNKEKYS